MRSKDKLQMSKTSCTTTSVNVADTPASRTPIGREIPDTPASLAAVAPAKLAPAAGSTGINSGMNVQTQVPATSAKDVDSTVICGSHKSSSDDVSSKFSTDQFKNQGGPRSQMPGQQNSRSYDESGKAFKSTVTPDVGD
jgi:hypothetical protein